MGDKEYRPWILEQVLAAYIIGHYFVEMKQVYVSILMFVEMPITV